MTKLGITPGVHGDGTEEKVAEAGDAVKMDPKVFTVLQPTVIPIHPPPQQPRRRSAAGVIVRGILLFLLFVSCFTAGMVLIYGVDTIFSGLYGAVKSDQSSTTTATPERLGLVNPMGNDMRDTRPTADDEVKIFLNTIPVAKVMMIEGGNGGAEGKDGQQKEMNERPMHPYEQQEPPFDAFNNRPMQPPPFWAMQARALAHAQAVRQWRMRRLQQAMYEQQMMKEAMMRSEWAQYQMEQQQRAAMENQLAKAIAQARWEQTQRARAAEEYQTEMQRAQWAQQAQRAQWERAQQIAQSQQQQQLQQQQQQQQQQYFQQPWWAHQQHRQQQQQQQMQYYQDPNYAAQFYYPQQQQAAYYQQQYYQNQMPTRPHDASPAQILSMQQPAVPPAPEPAMHDKIYQEMQKKSQGMEFNAPSRPIWTAITPTPETPGNYDHDAIFQENLRKINENPSSTTPAPPALTTKVAEIKQVEGDNMFRDILSVFDEAEKKGETPTTTTDVFKSFEDDKTVKVASTEMPKIEEKEPEKEMTDAAVQVDIPTPSENIFKAVEEAKPEESQVPEEDNEGPVEQTAPVVVEDRFPRIGDRTTVATEVTTAAPDNESDEDMEHDPLAAFLKYFEQEAQKMHENKPSKTSSVIDSEVRRKEEPKLAQPAAVDEPEPHFQEFQNVPRMITV